MPSRIGQILGNARATLARTGITAPPTLTLPGTSSAVNGHTDPNAHFGAGEANGFNVPAFTVFAERHVRSSRR